jgi:thiol-disulfide isomerase/thioredoxin
MRRAIAGCLSVGLLFWFTVALSFTQVLNKHFSGQVLNKNFSGQVQKSPPGKPVPAPSNRSPGKKAAATPRSSGGTLPIVEKVGLATLKRILAGDSGNVVLLNAWATWCKPCADEMPGLLKTWRSYRGKPLRLILLSTDDLDELETKVRPALKKFGVDFPTYIMSDSSEDAFISGLNDEWSGALPATFFYDRKGELADMKVGERSYSQFKEAVERLLGK